MATTKKVTIGGSKVFNRIAAYLTLALLFLFVQTTNAALQFDVFLGYDGIVPPRGWFPIMCELHNDGPAFNAVIEVSGEQFSQGQIRRVPVDLPTNTRKRIVIPVYSSAHAWNVRLVDDRGKVRAEQPYQTTRKKLPIGFPMVAALARTTAGVPIFPEINSPRTQDQPVAARLQPALFPDNPLTLEGIDLLYLSSEKAADLTLPQVNALIAWLQCGGHLVVGIEQISDVSGIPWLGKLLPCEFKSSGNLTAHGQFQEWLRSPERVAFKAKARKHNAKKPDQANISLLNQETETSDDFQFESAPLPVFTTALRDGEPLIGDATTPLAIQAVRGRGLITVLTFSPEHEPFASWKNRDWFWARLAGIPRAAFQTSDYAIDNARLSSDGIFGSMIDSKQIRKLPLGWLLLLLAVYLIVIGPFDQYWLKKINRQMLTWITFPFYVLVFSCLIYLIGFHLRAGELEWNELSLVDILPDSQRAVLRGQTYLSIYSPANSHYGLASDQAFATLRGEYMGNYGGNQESSRATVLQRGNAFDADTFVPVWTSQLYVSDWLQASPVPLTMNATRQGTNWQVVIENKMDRKLEQARVVLNNRIYEVGDLAAQESKTLSLGTASGMALRDFAHQFTDRFRNAAQTRRNSFGNNANPLPDIALGSMAASFLSQANQTANNWENFTIPGGLDLTRFADEGQGILLAWDPDHSLTSAINQFSAKRTHRNTLLRLVISPN